VTLTHLALYSFVTGRECVCVGGVCVAGEPVKEADGYRWRKYGQKAIAASAYPRSYYRCSHNGCTAKKQVQRAVGGEARLVTTYEGEHSHAPPQPHALKAAAAAGSGGGGGWGSRSRPPPLRVGADALDGTAESLNSSEGSARDSWRGAMGNAIGDGRCCPSGGGGCSGGSAAGRHQELTAGSTAGDWCPLRAIRGNFNTSA
jgi:hypothetical protein